MTMYEHVVNKNNWIKIACTNKYIKNIKFKNTLNVVKTVKQELNLTVNVLKECLN